MYLLLTAFAVIGILASIAAIAAAGAYLLLCWYWPGEIP